MGDTTLPKTRKATPMEWHIEGVDKETQWKGEYLVEAPDEASAITEAEKVGFLVSKARIPGDNEVFFPYPLQITSFILYDMGLEQKADSKFLETINQFVPLRLDDFKLLLNNGFKCQSCHKQISRESLHEAFKSPVDLKRYNDCVSRGLICKCFKYPGEDLYINSLRLYRRLIEFNGHQTSVNSKIEERFPSACRAKKATMACWAFNKRLIRQIKNRIIPPPERCDRCSESDWTFIDISPSGVAARWKCGYCGTVLMTKADDCNTEASRQSSGERQPISKEIQREVWQRDQGKCVECGSREALEFDHIIAFSRGGANTVRNLQLLCGPCNRRKSDKPPGSY